jgi:alpha-tubulin suppressor-like RCC1 family protein
VSRTIGWTRILAFAAPIVLLGCGEETGSPTGPDSGAALAVSTAATLSFRQVSAGETSTCALTTENRAYCWGYGFLGDGSEAHQMSRPVAVAGGLQFVQISAGGDHSCGLTGDNRAYCWGSNYYGQLGDGTSFGRLTPVPVAGGLSFRQLQAGGHHTCGVTTANVAYCWGGNYLGQLGDGTIASRSSPTAVAGGLSFRQVIAGDQHTCGATTGNRGYCWGRNAEGQLGIGIYGIRNGRQVPTAVLGGLSFRQVLAGRVHTCGVTTSDRAYCWGYNGDGELGNGTLSGRQTRPLAVVGGLSFRWLAPGHYHTCGTTLANKGYCWGRNSFGEVGDGTTSIRPRPVAVAGGLQFRMVTSGFYHSCGVTTDDRGFCWGYNNYAQVGDGTELQRLKPRAVVGPS